MLGTVPDVSSSEQSDARPDLTEQDMAILDFADRFYRFQGAQHEAIREEFDLSWVQYFQRLNALLDHPQSYLHNPRLVRRLQAIRVRQRNLHGRASTIR